MLTINTNIASMNAIRSQAKGSSQLATTLARLSSGLRVNSAKDDAAGLAISTRMETQIRGMGQARRNINDAISMMQTSEGALGSLTEIFQRGRELAVQAANATNSDSDRAALQSEINQLISEVDRISTDTEFNSIKLFAGGSTEVSYDPDSTGLTADDQRILDSLKTSWLEQSESIVEQYYGIKASKEQIEIIFDTDTGDASAYVSYTPGANGPVGLELHINTQVALSAMDAYGDWPNQPLDNLVAHEMVHAVMAATTSMGTAAGAGQMPKWFTEGAAEFLPGGDVRLNNVLTGGTSAASVIAELDNIQGSNWDTTDIQYSAAYVATRMLHEEIKNNGTSAGAADGVKDLMQWLAADNTRTLDGYLSTYTSFSGANDFIDNHVQGATNGVDFINNTLDLANADGGGIGGLDADGGAVRSFASAVPDIDNYSSDPLANFSESFPTGSRAIQLASTQSLQFQIGANSGEIIEIDLVGVNAGNLGIADIDLTTDWDGAISRFDAALDAVNSQRSRMGAAQNRLESAAASMEVGIENTSASRSRIVDADYAQETAELTRSNILNQAQIAMISQANSMPNVVLSLLA